MFPKKISFEGVFCRHIVGFYGERYVVNMWYWFRTSYLHGVSFEKSDFMRQTREYEWGTASKFVDEVRFWLSKTWFRFWRFPKLFVLFSVETFFCFNWKLQVQLQVTKPYRNRQIYLSEIKKITQVSRWYFIFATWFTCSHLCWMRNSTYLRHMRTYHTSFFITNFSETRWSEFLDLPFTVFCYIFEI